jgi:hypothetical protein
VAALHAKLQKVHQGVEWRRREHAERAMSAGRAVHTTKGTRRRGQRELERQNEDHMRILRRTSARLATPSAIALLTGKPLPGAGGGDAPSGGGGDE